MSKDYFLFDKQADSVTVMSFVDNGFDGKNLFELGFAALEDARLSRALSLEEFSGISNCEWESGGEDSEQIDALMNLAEELESTAESSEGSEIRVTELFQVLRDMVGGGDGIDAVHVFEQAIRCIKQLQMDLHYSFC